MTDNKQVISDEVPDSSSQAQPDADMADAPTLPPTETHDKNKETETEDQPEESELEKLKREMAEMKARLEAKERENAELKKEKDLIERIKNLKTKTVTTSDPTEFGLTLNQGEPTEGIIYLCISQDIDTYGGHDFFIASTDDSTYEVLMTLGDDQPSAQFRQKWISNMAKDTLRQTIIEIPYRIPVDAFESKEQVINVDVLKKLFSIPKTAPSSKKRKEPESDDDEVLVVEPKTKKSDKGKSKAKIEVKKETSGRTKTTTEEIRSKLDKVTYDEDQKSWKIDVKKPTKEKKTGRKSIHFNITKWIKEEKIKWDSDKKCAYLVDDRMEISSDEEHGESAAY